MTGTELDDILADNGSQGTEPTPNADTSVARDDQGRFAPKVEAQPSVVPEHSQNGETANAEADHGNIPPAALAASRQKAREKEQENETLRREIAELRGQFQGFSQRQQQAPQVKEEAKPAPEIWDDPRAFVRAELDPVQSQLNTALQSLAKETAIVRHTEEKVTAAERAFLEAMQSRTLHPADYETVVGAPNRYSAAVAWHQKHQTLQRVGDNPDAWLEAEIEKRLADPAQQGKFLERIQATAQQNSRSNPVTNLPPSLTRLPSGGNSTPGDMSDGSLFANALR